MSGEAGEDIPISPEEQEALRKAAELLVPEDCVPMGHITVAMYLRPDGSRGFAPQFNMAGEPLSSALGILRLVEYHCIEYYGGTSGS